jgi:hypothetical protein
VVIQELEVGLGGARVTFKILIGSIRNSLHNNESKSAKDFKDIQGELKR